MADDCWGSTLVGSSECGKLWNFNRGVGNY